jgi:hypothetical protein
MSLAAVSSAFASVLAKMGLANSAGGNKTDHELSGEDSDDEASTCSVGSIRSAVSNRMSLMDRGIDVPPVYPDHSEPSFVKVPGDARISHFNEI